MDRPPNPIGARGRGRGRYATILVVGYAIWVASFEAVGRYAQTLPTRDLTTAWDRAVPLVPAFIWPYELCYVLPFVALLVIRDRRRLEVALVAMLVASLAAFVAYLAVPVAFPRPALGASVSERLIALEYATDFKPGANNLPSLHVALSWILGRAMHRERGRLVDVFIFTGVAAITVSTVLVKQHLLLDVATGIAWAIGSLRVAERLRLSSARQSTPCSRSLL
jgi:membrane-associated phospholipid phosphatase